MYQKPSKRFAKNLLSLLTLHYPKAQMQLRYSNNFELLVAVCLSAQCTDKMVNKVTEKLFKKYTTIKAFANADIKSLEQDIKSTGFYHNKAKHLKAAAQLVLGKYHGKVPMTMKEIQTIPGVARKTANVVLGNAYGIVDGIAVDTHVRRLSLRFGLTKNTDPVKIEKDLMQLFDKGEWFTLTYKFIDHGRAFCTARNPKCTECFLNKVCPSAFQLSASLPSK